MMADEDGRFDELVDAVNSAHKRLTSLETLLADFVKSHGSGVSGGSPPSMHPGRFELLDRGQTVDIVCPHCGNTQLGVPKPVVEVTKEVVKEKEVIPKDYMKVPDSVGGVLPLLELKHEDGRSVFDCPNCSKEVDSWLQKHQTQLQKLGWKKSR